MVMTEFRTKGRGSDRTVYPVHSEKEYSKTYIGKNPKEIRELGGVPAKREWTRVYSGRLIKDYGWHRLRRDIERHHSNIFLLDDTPAVAPPNSEKLARKRSVRISNNDNVLLDKRFDGLYSPVDHAWYFYDPVSGNKVNLNDAIRTIEGGRKDKWYVIEESSDGTLVRTQTHEDVAHDIAKMKTHSKRAAKRSTGYKRYTSSTDDKYGWRNIEVIREDKLLKHGHERILIRSIREMGTLANIDNAGYEQAHTFEV